MPIGSVSRNPSCLQKHASICSCSGMCETVSFEGRSCVCLEGRSCGWGSWPDREKNICTGLNSQREENTAGKHDAEPSRRSSSSDKARREGHKNVLYCSCLFSLVVFPITFTSRFEKRLPALRETRLSSSCCYPVVGFLHAFCTSPM